MKRFLFGLVLTGTIFFNLLRVLTGCTVYGNSTIERNNGISENNNGAISDEKTNSEKDPDYTLDGKEYDLPVIMYHSVLPESRTAFTLSTEELEKDFKYIKEKGYRTVTANELIAFTEGKGVLPEKPIMLTFDDGYYNNFVYVFPLLEKYDLKCVVAIVGAFSDSKDNREGKPQSLKYSHINKYQIKEASEGNRVEIQHHSYSLHSYGKARKGIRINKGESYEEYKNMLTEDTLKLNEWLLKNCQIVPTAYFYPFGAWCKEGYEILKELGFKATFGVEAGLNKIKKGTELKNLYRYNRTGNIASDKFFEKYGI